MLKTIGTKAKVMNLNTIHIYHQHGQIT